jgi:hypothetical protein
MGRLVYDVAGCAGTPRQGDGTNRLVASFLQGAVLPDYSGLLPPAASKVRQHNRPYPVAMHAADYVTMCPCVPATGMCCR